VREVVRAITDYRVPVACVFLSLGFAAALASTLNATGSQGLAPIGALFWVVVWTILAWRSWLSARAARRAKK
jgi:hypothetical protein